MGSVMIYHIFVTSKFDPFSYKALLELSKELGVVNRDGNPNISKMTRIAVLFMYMVVKEGMEPERALLMLDEYHRKKLMEMELLEDASTRRRARARGQPGRRRHGP